MHILADTTVTHALADKLAGADSAQSDTSQNKWRAELELWFENRAERTCLARRKHVGPLAVQHAFHPERDGTAHVYLLHPPGGVAGGDSLEIACHLDAGAKALLTAPGATKFYRSAGRLSTLRTIINVGRGGVCEYLPQETIIFDGASASIETQVTLAPGAVCLGWEVVSLGRPFASESFTTGSLRHRVTLIRDGRPIWYERLAVAGGSALTSAPFAFAGKPVFGVMVYAGPMVEALVERIRAATNHLGPHGAFSASQLEDVVACRYLGARMSEAKSLFLRAWQVLRESGLGKPAIQPRIWST
jgi:urease accessory protein